MWLTFLSSKSFKNNFIKDNMEMWETLLKYLDLLICLQWKSETTNNIISFQFYICYDSQWKSWDTCCKYHWMIFITFYNNALSN